MYQFKLPLSAHEILISTEPNEDYIKVITSYGVDWEQADYVLYWLNHLMPIFNTALKDEPYLPELNGFIATACGLYQLKILSVRGDDYIELLKNKLLGEDVDVVDVCEFARRTYDLISADKTTLDIDELITRSSALVGLPQEKDIELEIPISNRVYSGPGLQVVLHSFYYLNILMCYELTQKMTTLINQPTVELLLNQLIDDLKKKEDHLISPLYDFMSQTSLHLESIKKERIKTNKAKLRLL